MSKPDSAWQAIIPVFVGLGILALGIGAGMTWGIGPGLAVGGITLLAVCLVALVARDF